MKHPSIVIPYKMTRSNELIYALRSLKNLPHSNVVIIGNKPFGINLEKVTFIPFTQTIDISKNVLNIINLACTLPEVTDDFILMADDQYILEPITKLPVYHRGTYDEVIKSYRHHTTNYYIRRMKETNRYLKELGIEEPLCYEMHIPFKMNKQKWLDLNLDPKHNKLSMYGNIYKIGGTKHEDVKVRTKDWIPEGVFASSYEATFGTNKLGELVRGKFSEKGEYES